MSRELKSNGVRFARGSTKEQHFKRTWTVCVNKETIREESTAARCQQLLPSNKLVAKVSLCGSGIAQSV